MRNKWNVKAVCLWAALALLSAAAAILVVRAVTVHASAQDENWDDEQGQQTTVPAGVPGACESQLVNTPGCKKALVRLFEQGKRIFRFDTFGDEDYWGGKLQLHKAIEGAALGGVGPGVSPNSALTVAGLKVDVTALPGYGAASGWPGADQGRT